MELPLNISKNGSGYTTIILWITSTIFFFLDVKKINETTNYPLSVYVEKKKTQIATFKDQEVVEEFFADFQKHAFSHLLSNVKKI